MSFRCDWCYNRLHQLGHGTAPLTLEFDHWIGTLYRAGAKVRPEHFRRQALEGLRQWIPFDGALWGNGTLETLSFHTFDSINLPDGFADALEQTRHLNPILPRILQQLGRPVTMESVFPDAQFFDSELYRCTFAPFGIHRILSTGLTDERGGLYTLLSLYRRDADRPFTADEVALHERAVFHLVNAASHLVFTFLNRRQNDVPDSSAACVCDGLGLYHEVQAKFLDMAERHFPEAPRGRLPFALDALSGEDCTLNGLSVRVQRLGDLFVVRIWPCGPMDELTVREREVVESISRGLTFKETARRLGVAPSTVSNHLYRVYQKLGVHSRSALARLVHEQDGS